MKDTYIPLLERLGIETENINALHWVGVIACITLLFYTGSLICKNIVVPLIHKITRKTHFKWDDIIFNATTIKHLFNLVIGIALTASLPLFMNGSSMLHGVATKICQIYITIVFVGLCCSVLTSLHKISCQAKKTKNHTLQGVFQMLKIIIICIGTIYVASIVIDKDPTKLFAGLGASAAVLMLVFKDSIMGLVAGVQLSANNMLKVGDWISLPQRKVDGEVEEVSLTTIKVRAWDKTLQTLPPYLLISEPFDNWQAMRLSGGRRIKRSLNIDMTSIKFANDEFITKLRDNEISRSLIEPISTKSAENEMLTNLDLFMRSINDYLLKHPRVNPNMIVMVRQLQPTEWGLPIEIYCFSADVNWIPYENLQTEIISYVVAVAPHFDLRIYQAPSEFGK